MLGRADDRLAHGLALDEETRSSALSPLHLALAL